MKNFRGFRTSAYLAVVLGAVFIGSAFAGTDTLRTGDKDTMGQWYGRAGGLVGSDRVMATGKPAVDTKTVGIKYDADVAQRTNMPRGEVNAAGVGIAYDKDVAARTNMPRGEEPASIKAAGVNSK